MKQACTLHFYGLVTIGFVFISKPAALQGADFARSASGIACILRSFSLAL